MRSRVRLPISHTITHLAHEIQIELPLERKRSPAEWLCRGSRFSVFVCEKLLSPLLQELSSRGGVQSNRTLIVSRLESYYGAPAGTRTPDTLLKRQVLYLLSDWGISSEQALERLASVAVPPLKREGLIPRRSPTRSPAQRVRVGRGRRNLRIRSFRRPGGSGVDQASSDVAGMAGLEPTISESKSGVLPLHYIPVSGQKRPAWPASE